MRGFRIRTCSQGGWPPGRAPGQLRPRCRPLHQTARAHRPCRVHTHSTTGSRLNSLQWSLHIEAALTWGPTAGRGPGGRLPDYLKPVRKGGPGPEVFIPWRNVLRLAGERAPDGDASSYLRVRYKRRIDAMRAAGLLVGGQAAPAGDTVEIVRVVDGRGKGRSSGIIVRATDRFVEAYRLGQDSKAWELLPSSRLFLPDQQDSRGPSHRQTCHQARRGAGAGGRACRASCKRPSESRSHSPCCSTRASRPLIRSRATARATAVGDPRGAAVRLSRNFTRLDSGISAERRSPRPPSTASPRARSRRESAATRTASWSAPTSSRPATTSRCSTPCTSTRSSRASGPCRLYVRRSASTRAPINRSSSTHCWSWNHNSLTVVGAWPLRS